MSSDSNQIQIDSINQTFIINIDTTLIDSGDIVVQESYFFIEQIHFQ